MATKEQKELNDADEYHSFLDDGIDVHFTWRAVLVGSLLGCIVGASNLYLGLKTGWAFGASIFGAILGFAILKPISLLGSAFGGPFGMKENCTVQAAATAVGGLTSTYVAAVPALFHLNLLPDIDECWTRFYLWTTAAAFYGMFFAVPLRSYYVLKKKLVFPNCTATARTIQALHSDQGSSQQATWIAWSFCLSIAYKVGAYFVPVLSNMHVMYWLSLPTDSTVLYSIDRVWQWKLHLSTAFMGAGMLVGPVTALSFFGGNLLAWGVVGPLMFYCKTDVLHVTPFGFSDEGATVQVWNLWVGIVIMLVSSFTDLGFQYATVWKGLRGCADQFYNALCYVFPQLQAVEVRPDYDPVKEEHQVPTWMWLSGLTLALSLTLFVLGVYFHMSVGYAIIAAILGFLFSFIGCQAAGDIDINPIGVVAKSSQLVFAAMPGTTIQSIQRNNIMAAAVSSSCAIQAVDMVGDLKTGHLLKTSPRSQLYAQVLGSFVGISVSVPLFMLFAKAYPCILVASAKDCPFTVPAALAWAGVTRALTTDISKSVPPSCQIACIVAAVLTFGLTVLKNTHYKAHAAKFPSLSVIGLAFANPAPFIPLANTMGCLVGIVCSTLWPAQWEKVVNSLASGMIAGEGIGGLVHAIFNIVGLSQLKLAFGFGCPNQNPLAC